MPKKIIPLLVASLFLGYSLVLAGEKININLATADELDRLKGVGAKTAMRIIEFRERNGPFQKPEDITLVKGIGRKLFEKNRDSITVKNNDDGAGDDPVPLPKLLK